MVNADQEAATSNIVTAYLSLGANLGHCRVSLRAAIGQLHNHPQITVDPHRDVARLYRSSPVDCAGDPPPFFNTVVRIQTSLDPMALLCVIQAIERSLGRRRDGRPTTAVPGASMYEARTIDIDILLAGDLVFSSDRLEIPHPRLRQRRFVLAPLADLVPNLVLPGGGTVAAALRACRQRFPGQSVELVEDVGWVQGR